MSVPNINLIFFLIISQSLKFSSHPAGFSSPCPSSQRVFGCRKKLLFLNSLREGHLALALLCSLSLMFSPPHLVFSTSLCPLQSRLACLIYWVPWADPPCSVNCPTVFLRYVLLVTSHHCFELCGCPCYPDLSFLRLSCRTMLPCMAALRLSWITTYLTNCYFTYSCCTILSIEFL